MTLLVLGVLLLAVLVGIRILREETAADQAGVQVTSRPLGRGEDRRRGSWKAVAWTGPARVTALGWSRQAAEKKARRELGSLLAARARTRHTGGQP